MSQFDQNASLPADLLQQIARLLPDGQTIRSVVSLPGGGNNRVFRLSTAARDYLLKWYFRSPQDPRDRWQAEWEFSNFVWGCGVRHVPEPIASDPQAGFSLFQYVAGRRLRPDEIGLDQVTRAAKFLAQLNQFRDIPAAQGLPQASEACFSIAEHLERVNERVRRLWVDAGEAPLSTIREFVQGPLTERVTRVTDQIRQAALANSHQIADVLPRESRIVSPSDFGFHNALVDEQGELCFFDFEYAGWDDPAKTACDFFSQVAVPVPSSLWHDFLAVLSSVAGDQLRWRAELLLPLYRVKWCCIILNSLVKGGRERRDFSGNSSSSSQSAAACLELAKQTLARSEAQDG